VQTVVNGLNTGPRTIQNHQPEQHEKSLGPATDTNPEASLRGMTAPACRPSSGGSQQVQTREEQVDLRDDQRNEYRNERSLMKTDGHERER